MNRMRHGGDKHDNASALYVVSWSMPLTNTLTLIDVDISMLVNLVKTAYISDGSTHGPLPEQRDQNNSLHGDKNSHLCSAPLPLGFVPTWP